MPITLKPWTVDQLAHAVSRWFSFTCGRSMSSPRASRHVLNTAHPCHTPAAPTCLHVFGLKYSSSFAVSLD
jgi:hypothetical protein